MTFTEELCAGIRTVLLGLHPTVVIGLFDENTPDSAIAIVPIPLDDNNLTGQILASVQVRIRGAASGGVRPVLALQEQALLALQGAHQLTTYTVIETWRQMSAPLSLDGQGRPELFDTYYLRSDRLGRTG